MDTNYVLPIALAAALHGAVLFGFPKSQRVPLPKADDAETVCRFPMLPPPDEPEIVVATEVVAKPSGRPDAPPVPTSPEPPTVVLPTDITIKPEAVSVDTSELIDISIIPPVRRGDGEPVFDRDIISSVFLDNTPRARFQPAPIYPYNGKKEGLRGEVLVEFMVDESGSVIEPRVVRSSHRMFEDPSLRAVSKWKFEPGRRQGRVVRFRMSVPVVFNLNE